MTLSVNKNKMHPSLGLGQVMVKQWLHNLCLFWGCLFILPCLTDIPADVAFHQCYELWKIHDCHDVHLFSESSSRIATERVNKKTKEQQKPVHKGKPNWHARLNYCTLTVCKNYSTQYSRVVPHHSTDCAITSLTSEIRRDPVLSGVYGRSYNFWLYIALYTLPFLTLSPEIFHTTPHAVILTKPTWCHVQATLTPPHCTPSPTTPTSPPSPPPPPLHGVITP